MLLALAVCSTLAVIRWRRRTRRQRTLLMLCRDAGLEYSVLDPFENTMFLPFRLFGPAVEHGVQNVIWEHHDDGAVRVFDYWCMLDDDRTSARAEVACAIVPLPFAVPPVAVIPRDVVRIPLEPVPVHSVSLELEAFNRRFDVRAEDPRAAVAFLDQRMMDAILQVPLRVAIHVHEDRMLLVGPLLDPGAMLLLLEVARRLPTRVPPVVASLYPPRPVEGPFEDRWMQGSWSPAPISADDSNPADLGG